MLLAPLPRELLYRNGYYSSTRSSATLPRLLSCLNPDCLHDEPHCLRCSISSANLRAPRPVLPLLAVPVVRPPVAAPPRLTGLLLAAD